MPTIEPYSGDKVIHAKTSSKNANDPKTRNARWWLVKDKSDLANSIFGVVNFLKQNQNYRQHQAALYARMYGNLPVWNYLGTVGARLDAKFKFPTDRPTLNVVQSCVDALISRMTQSKPKPVFLTEGGNYKKRKLAKDLNRFIDGEFYQTKAYQIGEQVLRDSMVIGDGLVKVIETDDNRVGIERTLCTEVFVDEADGMYGFPQQMHQLKLMDRDMAAELYPKYKSSIMEAEAASFGSTSEQSRDSIVSQIMVAESWHLPSAKEAKDGRHVIAIANDILFEEQYEEDDFPFVRLPYAPRTLGYWSQGLPEQLMGIQSEINRLLYTIQQSLHLCGIPKWLVEDGSKVVSGHINNQIGGLIKYQGTPPVLQVAQTVAPDLYQQLERLVMYAYQQSGISMLAASSQKPQGLNSGAALREYDDLQSDRFAYLSQRYENYYIDLAKKMFAKAKKIAEREGEYQTIYPGQDSLLKVDFPKDDIAEEEFIIQLYPASALAKNPAQRKQEVIDLMQAGLIDPEEGRRLLDYPDLRQEQDLMNAPKERLLKLLDEIVEEGKYTPPDPSMNLDLAKKLCLQYQNKYVQEELEESKMDLLRAFNSQINRLKAMAMAAMMPPVDPMMTAGAGAASPPMADPMAPPVSPMVPNVAVA